MPNNHDSLNDSSPAKCCARRHMPAAAFKTYDAIKSMCKRQDDGSLLWFGRVHMLANLNNRSTEQERSGIDWLETKGWLEKTEACLNADYQSQQRRKHGGLFTTFEYRVIEHDEYAENNDDCPAPRYDPRTGEPTKPGQLADSLIFRNVRRWVNADLPPIWMKQIWDARQARKKNPPSD